MKAFLLCCVFLLLACASGNAQDPDATATPAAVPRSQNAPAVERLPGVELAEAVSQVTGTAISPLLGVSATGAWRYYRTPVHLRERLPWYCHPAVWGAGFAILACCLLKDTFGAAAPMVLKKPLDMVELFEDKLSALVASAAFVPLIAAHLALYSHPEGGAQAWFGPDVHYASVWTGLSMIDARLFLVPLSVTTFLVVWVVSHAVHVLIALSPFRLVDATLKLGKAAVLSSIVGLNFISPYLSAALSVAVILVAIFLAPRAFRFTLFGTLFALDILLPGRGRKRATPAQAHAFMARQTADVPARTLGRLQCGPDGALQFVYRPCFILPSRRVPMPAGDFIMAKGVIHPSLLHRPAPGAPATSLLLFLPRYRNHEETIAANCGIGEVRESSLARGFSAMRAWFAEILSSGRSAAVQALPSAPGSSPA